MNLDKKDNYWHSNVKTTIYWISENTRNRNSTFRVPSIIWLFYFPIFACKNFIQGFDPFRNWLQPNFVSFFFPNLRIVFWTGLIQQTTFPPPGWLGFWTVSANDLAASWLARTLNSFDSANDLPAPWLARILNSSANTLANSYANALAASGWLELLTVLIQQNLPAL